MKKYILIVILVNLLFFNAFAHSQKLLWDDTNSCNLDWCWSYFLDTLVAHGAETHFVSDEGWDNLMNMDMLWISCGPHLYDYETKSLIIEFAKKGNVVYWTPSDMFFPSANDLLSDPRWHTTLEIGDSCRYELWTCIDSFQIIPFPPFTNGVNPFILRTPPAISCGENAYPFYVIKGGNTIYPVAAISYPFRQEGNCSTFVILATSTGWWELLNITYPDEYHFASNMLFVAAGMPGYELEPGAIPGGGNACELAQQEYTCSRVPNPFTPNGDGKNDFSQFTFERIGEKEATIRIFDMHSHQVRTIKVPTGTAAKSAARWDGRDDSGNSLTEGLYLYTIECEEEIVCDGTVVIAR